MLEGLDTWAGAQLGVLCGVQNTWTGDIFFVTAPLQEVCSLGQIKG